MDTDELKNIISGIEEMPVWKLLVLYNEIVTENQRDHEEPKESDARFLMCYDDDWVPFLMTSKDIMKDFQWLTEKFRHLDMCFKNDELVITSGSLVRQYSTWDIWENLLRFSVEKEARDRVLRREYFLHDLHKRGHPFVFLDQHNAAMDLVRELEDRG